MYAYVKLVALAFCLFPLANIILSPFGPSPYDKPNPSQPVHVQHHSDANTAKTVVLVEMILAELGAAVLMIDAFMRKYSAPKGLPIALAVMGLLTLGMSSVVYFAMWGRHPLHAEIPIATEFCAACIASTLDRPAPGAATHNFVGTQFTGSADRCPTCGSSVKTLWISFLFPLIPVGSYRLLSIGDASVIRSNYVGRKTSLNISQVCIVYAIDLSIVVIFMILIR